MKKFKTLFILATICNILGVAPLIFISFNPEMMEELVFSQFPGINDAGKEALSLIHFVFGIVAISIIEALIASINIKVKESAQTAAMILLIIHIGWALPDLINFATGGAHPPVPVMILGIIAIISLGYAWKKGEV